MTRLAGILLCVAWTTPLFGQGDFLSWREGVRLSWQDFRGPIDPTQPEYQGAASHLSIAIQMSCTNGVPDVQVSADFDRSRSWARPNMPSGLLAHEQVHFDIAELYARRTRQEWPRIEAPCANAAAVREIASRNSQLAEGLQEIYDEETNHGTIPAAQEEWSRRIRRLLDASIND